MTQLIGREDEVRNEAGKSLYDLYTNILKKSEKASLEFPVIAKSSNEFSRDNLLAYLALRENDLSHLQISLSNLGLSSLGRLEGDVILSLEQVLGYLGYSPRETSLQKPNFDLALNILEERSKRLLGRPRDGRKTRIMVTLDAPYIYQPELLEQLLVSGMDIARINCAHDSEREWLMLITAIRAAEERLEQRGTKVGRTCRILMDLAGPKIRTGPLALEARPLKLSVSKDYAGKTVRMLEGLLDSEAELTESLSLTGMLPGFTISLKKKPNLSNLIVGGRLDFKDSRGKKRSLIVLQKLTPSKVRIGLPRTAYLDEGIELESETSEKFVVGTVKPQPVEIRVKLGDHLRLYRDPARLGTPATEGTVACISCTLPEALNYVKTGDRVFIDDGKIGGVVRNANEEFLELEITAPAEGVISIKSEKGLNFPDSSVNISALTEEDQKNLEFVTTHATAVGLSFVHRASDLRALHECLAKLGHENFGIVAKIETREAVHRLGEILLGGLNLPNFGVLIARGDLAVEVGFENLAFVQEDVLCMCDAAHVPVIIATQVLETLAKSGLPTRAEITDAAMGIRAECVMLNKGPHILDALRTLANLLAIEERHQMKKRQIFKEFTEQLGIFQKIAAGSK
ncbi:MAG TPA: pyruvate kinase [Nitrososphaerales archaeon]|nr:pyruvate kinase [Nitrososphaerales archaeon]